MGELSDLDVLNTLSIRSKKSGTKRIRVVEEKCRRR